MATTTENAIKRVPKPDHDKFQAELKTIKDTIDKLIEKRNTLNSKFSRNANEGQNNKRNELRKKLEEIRMEQGKIKKTRLDSIQKIKDLQAQRRKRNDKIRETKSKLQIQNANDIDGQIKNLEKQIEMGVSANEEKKLLQEITKLNQAKNTLTKVESSNKGSNIDEEIKALESTIKDLNEKRKPLEESYTAVKAELDVIEEKRRAESANFKGIKEERNKLQEEIEANIEKRRELSNSFKTQKEEFAKFMAAERKRKNEEYQKRKQAERDEMLARKFQNELELAEIPAFTEEVNTCNTLIGILKAQLDSNKSEIAPAAEKASLNLEDSIPKGAIMLSSKNDREEEFFFSGKKKNNKRQHKVKEAKNAPIKYDLGVMESFWSIKVNVPTSIEEVETTIKVLEDKKADYLKNREAQTKKNKEEAERKIAEHRKRIEAGEEDIEEEEDKE